MLRVSIAWMVPLKATMMEANPLVEKMKAAKNPKESKLPRGWVMISCMVPLTAKKASSGKTLCIRFISWI